MIYSVTQSGKGPIQSLNAHLFQVKLLLSWESRDPPWLWNPGQTLPGLYKRVFSDPTKRTYDLYKIFKKTRTFFENQLTAIELTSQICSFLPGSLTLTACNGTLSPFQWSDTLKTFSVFLWFFVSFFSFNGKYYGVYGKHQRDYCLYNSAKLVKLYFSENWSSLDVLIFIFLLLNCPYNHACACALQEVLLQAALVTVYK